MMAPRDYVFDVNDGALVGATSESKGVQFIAYVYSICLINYPMIIFPCPSYSIPHNVL